jgi:hypothetical protein
MSEIVLDAFIYITVSNGQDKLYSRFYFSFEKSVLAFFPYDKIPEISNLKEE